jgi:hypothetical protein
VNPILRTHAMLIDPAAEWPAIEQERGDAAYLMSRYVAVLALVPAVCSFVGASLIGVIEPSGATVYVPLLHGLAVAMFGYVAAFVALLLLGLAIDLLAPLFDGERNFANALKLAVYSSTPAWLAGVFLLLPGLRFLTLTGFYGLYVLSLGLPRMMKSSEEKSPLYVTAIAVLASLLLSGVVAAQRALFGVLAP